MLIMCFQLAAQNQRVTGTVTDAASGEPVMGATVVVKGTQNAAVTGMEGEYTLNNVPANSVLVFEYLGYAKQEVTITAGMTVANVKLSEDNEQIEQVVVIGYGSARSVGSVTGSVSVVDANILNDKPVMNLPRVRPSVSTVRAPSVQVPNLFTSSTVCPHRPTSSSPSTRTISRTW